MIAKNGWSLIRYLKLTLGLPISPSTGSGRTVKAATSVRGEPVEPPFGVQDPCHQRHDLCAPFDGALDERICRPFDLSKSVRPEPVEPPAWVGPSSNRNGLFFVGLLALFAVLLAACSGDATPPRDLLLGAEDFPDTTITETSREDGTTNLDEPAVQVELSSPEFNLLESLVLFENEDIARSILAGIKQDQIARGVTAEPVTGFEDNSGVMSERLNGEDALTVFFVEGRALVRLTLSGDGGDEMVWAVARLAREKSGG